MGGTVNLVSKSGDVVELPQEEADLAVRQGAGRPATPEEMDRVIYGGTLGKVATAVQGAADVATFGISTGLNQEISQALGGDAGRDAITEAMKKGRAENPISYTLGESAPFVLLPGAEGEGAARAGEGLLTRALDYAAPRVVRGALEMGHMQGSEGISEDLLDHDLAAESYWSHIKPGEALFGGALGAGAEAGIGKLAGLGKTRALADLAGAEGPFAARSGALADDVIRAGQVRGATSDETSAGLKEVDGLLSQRSALHAEDRSWFDKNVLDPAIDKLGADPAMKRAYRLKADHGIRAEEVLEDKIAAHGADAKVATNDLLDSLTRMDGADFQMRHDNAHRLVDKQNFQAQGDATLRMLRELNSLVNEPALPAPVKSIEHYEKRALRNLKEAGVTGPSLSMRDVKVDTEGMRPESFDMVRAQREAGEAMKPVEVSHYPDTGYSLTDGRHRVAVARERGEGAIDALVRRYDAAGNATKVERTRLPFEPLDVPAIAKQQAERLRARDLEAYEAAAKEAIAKHESVIGEDVPAEFRNGGLRSINAQVRDTAEMADAVGAARRDVASAIRAGADGGGSGKTYLTIDGLKKHLGRGAFREDTAPLEMNDRFRQWYYNNRLKPMLEDEQLWGQPLAKAQADGNSAVSDSHIPTEAFRKRFGVLVGKTKEGLPIHQANDGEIAKALENIGSLGPGKHDVHEDLVQRALDGAIRRSAALKEHGILDAGGIAATDKAAKSAVALKGIIESARPIAEDLRNVRGMTRRTAGFGARGIVGKALGVVTNPVKALETVAAFRSLTNKTTQWAREVSSDFLGGVKGKAVKLSMGEAEKKAAVQAIDDANRYRSEPRTLAVALRGHLGNMPDLTPQMASSVATVAAKSAVTLATLAPQPLPPKFTSPSTETRYNPSELATYWRNLQLVRNPKLAGDLLKSGQLHQDDLTTLDKFAPRTLGLLRQQVMADMLRKRALGELRTFSYQEQQRLSWLIGRPLDATQSPMFTRAMQEGARTDPINQAAFGSSATGGGSPSEADSKRDQDRVMTESEKMEGGDE